jgi:ABC-type enterobactin transport system permease subunit
MMTHCGFTRERSVIADRSRVFFERKKRAVSSPSFLLSGLVILFFFFCGSGFIHIPFLDVLAILFSHTIENQLWQDVVFNIRLPRILGCMLIGGILAGCGTFSSGPAQSFGQPPLPWGFLLVRPSEALWLFI